MKIIIRKAANTIIHKYISYTLILLLITLIISTIILGSVPPVDRDALTHHLFIPKLWLKHGGIYEIPEIPFSYYPMNIDLLYTIPLYFGNDIIPKYIHYYFALATALLLYRHLAKRLGSQFGLLGALFFLSVPIIVKLSITVYVDLGVVFFTTASLLLLLYWAETNFQIRYLVLAGLCCGLAAGSKYNGIIAIVALTLLAPIIHQQTVPKERQSNCKALLWGFVFVVATMISFSPWLIRNYAWTGNPIYPLHNSLFQRLNSQGITLQSTQSINTSDPLHQTTSQTSNAFISRMILYNEPWWQVSLLPIRFFFEGQDDNPQFFDGKLTPFLLFLPALAFLIRSRDRQQRLEQNILFSFALLYFFFTFFQEAIRVRYIVPIVPPLVILSMYGLHRLINQFLLWNNFIGFKITSIYFIAVCIPGLMLWYNWQYVASQFKTVNPLSYLQGTVSRDEYITNFRPEYPVIKYANSVVPPDAKVLCLFLGNRGYYMDFWPVFEQPYKASAFSLFSEMTNPKKDALLEEMRQRNITHVILRDDITVSWFNQLNEEKISFIAPLLNGASDPLFKNGGYTFFTVVQNVSR